jgi:hypothetical protein
LKVPCLLSHHYNVATHYQVCMHSLFVHFLHFVLNFGAFFNLVLHFVVHPWAFFNSFLLLSLHTSFIDNVFCGAHDSDGSKTILATSIYHNLSSFDSSFSCMYRFNLCLQSLWFELKLWIYTNAFEINDDNTIFQPIMWYVKGNGKRKMNENDQAMKIVKKPWQPNWKHQEVVVLV